MNVHHIPQYEGLGVSLRIILHTFRYGTKRFYNPHDFRLAAADRFSPVPLYFSAGFRSDLPAIRELTKWCHPLVFTIAV
jgi:hypothetical protein